MSFGKGLFLLAVLALAVWLWRDTGRTTSVSGEATERDWGISGDLAALPPEHRQAIEAAMREASSPEDFARRIEEINRRFEAGDFVGSGKTTDYVLNDYDDRYQTVNLHGWSVRVSRALVAGNRNLAMQCVAEIDTQLRSISDALPGARLASLRLVPIWLEQSVPGMQVIVYHTDSRWLEERGLNTQKGGGVDIPEAMPFLMNVRTQPGMILHELSHAYHMRAVMDRNAEIVAAYQQAKNAGLYANVASIDGSAGRAYALTDEKEYFAELTEAYFLKNDFFPFNREELRKYDPTGYALIERLWLQR